MSYDLSGLLPSGSLTAVRHRVSVFSGAPVPVQAASAVPDVASDPAPTSIGAARTAASRVREESLANILLPPLTSEDDAHRRVCPPKQQPATRRFHAKCACLLLPYREDCLTVPRSGGRSEKSGVQEESSLGTMSVFRYNRALL